jgi:hypothetical protein
MAKKGKNPATSESTTVRTSGRTVETSWMQQAAMVTWLEVSEKFTLITGSAVIGKAMVAGCS